MLRSLVRGRVAPSMGHIRAMTTNTAQNNKKEGDISNAFASLSGLVYKPLPDRFREIKLQLVAGNEDNVIAGWNRLLKVLHDENQTIISRGSSIIPEIQFSNLHQDLASKRSEIMKRGAAVIRGVIDEDEARSYKFEIEEYVRQNPQTKGFPPENPQVLELYWSAPQVRARNHPNLLETQTQLMSSLWHVADPTVAISIQTPLGYADRLRIRQPGDAQFALGPHQDGGSVERWEQRGYGLGGVYDEIFRGTWERYDPYEAGGRTAAVIDLYNGLGSCSMFRMFQGWLAMSTSGPGQGTLQVFPLIKEGTAYTLLRPFFRPVKAVQDTETMEEFLAPENWVFTAGEDMNSDLQGATPGHGQEFPQGMHPHLELDMTMTHIPQVRPGDFVVWHCDGIHAVDKVHQGTSDSSVLYIPVCPTTESNARYMVRQRAAFLEGTPGPDFPGGKGESEHIGRPTRDYVKTYLGKGAEESMGLSELAVPENETPGAKLAVKQANAVLGF